jgi:hypothetical protein
VGVGRHHCHCVPTNVNLHLKLYTTICTGRTMNVPLCPEQLVCGSSKLTSRTVTSCSSSAAREVGEELNKSTNNIGKTTMAVYLAAISAYTITESCFQVSLWFPGNVYIGQWPRKGA